jgi:hypothetical protein
LPSYWRDNGISGSNENVGYIPIPSRWLEMDNDVEGWEGWGRWEEGGKRWGKILNTKIV